MANASIGARNQQCTVCGSDNNVLRLTCASCGAALRDRVAGLDLFDTAFSVLAEPGDTFVRIARSEQRNYMVALFSVSGFLLYTIALFGAGVGDSTVHFGLVILSYIAVAPAIGLIFAVIAGTIAALAAPLGIPSKRFRLHYTVQAWSLVPFAVASTVLVLVELSLFGQSLMSLEMPAFIVKPQVFWALFGAQSICVFWSMILLYMGIKTLGGTAVRSAVHTLVFYIILAIETGAFTVAVRLISTQAVE